MRLVFLFTLVVRFLLGSIFLISSVPKIVAPDRFFANIMEYSLTSAHIATLVAALLPWLEFTLGLACLGGVLLPGAFAVSAILLMVFATLQAWVVVNGLQVACGCFTVGGNGGMVSLFTVARTILFLALAIFGWWAIARLNVLDWQPTVMPESDLPASESTDCVTPPSTVPRRVL